MKKIEIKPGRSYSAMGIFGGLVGIVFIIGWIGVILHESRPWKNDIDPGEVFLLIFGVVFLITMIVNIIFHARMTFAKKRPSLLDIEEVTVDEMNPKESMETRTTPDGEINFCPYCGKTFKKDFSYCQYCGKKINT